MALVEGSEYGLLSRDNLTCSNISCIHVKLTDTALKAIEEFLKSKRSARPLIEIHDEEGVFKIPVSDGGSGYKEFAFSVSPLSGDPNGSLDCTRLLKTGKLETLDSMTQKILVKATDDVYQTTKDKLAEKNEESKKNCAKEINQTKGGIKSKKVTKTIKRTQNGITPHVVPKPTNDWQDTISSTTSRSPILAHSSPPRIVNSQAPPFTSSLINTANTAAKKLDKIKRKQKSKLNNTAAASAAQSKASDNSERQKVKAALLGVPLRERIIHLLALKPHVYSTPDLVVKLKSEGLGPNDTVSEINRILDSIAFKNSKDCWSLKKDCLSEVDVNWSFYLETDKQLVKRNLSQAQKQDVNTTYVANNDGIKRKHENDAPVPSSKRNCVPQSEPEPADVPRNNEEDDFLQKYKLVTSHEQRQQYKDEFSKEYPEYRKLFDSMQEITDKFAILAKELHATVVGSSEHHRIEKKIRKEYKAVKTKTQYVEHKERLEYLHRKLSHVKQLVSDYDNSISKTVSNDFHL